MKSATEFKLLGINFSVDLRDIPGNNYTPVLKTIPKTLSNWQRRNLTPIGKIAVIKTFVISALTHMFSAIPSPSSDVIMHLNQIFYSFIWNNKPHKICKRQITNTYIKGGLEMVNLENFIMSQKLVWIK